MLYNKQAIENLEYNIKESIYQLERQRIPRERIKIAMPTYAYNTLFALRQTFNDQQADNKQLFGCKVIEGYENKIIVFYDYFTPDTKDYIYEIPL